MPECQNTTERISAPLRLIKLFFLRSPPSMELYFGTLCMPMAHFPLMDGLAHIIGPSVTLAGHVQQPTG